MSLQVLGSYLEYFKWNFGLSAARGYPNRRLSSRSKTRPHITAVLIDISGNLHVGDKPTPRAVSALEKLQEASFPYRLCSNSSKESTESLRKRLTDVGFCTPKHDAQGRQLIWTSLGAVVQLVRSKGLKNPYLLLSASAKEEFQECPETGTESPPAVSSNTHDTYDGVVVGLAPKLFDYEHLNRAFRILKREVPGTQPSDNSVPPLIATHKAKYIQTESGLSLGPGPFVTALEEASSIKAIVVGKPTRSFFEIAIESLPDDIRNAGGTIAVIGDDVEADLGGGALELGLWRVLVRTGKYRVGDENKPGVIAPDEVFDDFASFVDNLLDRTEPA